MEAEATFHGFDLLSHGRSPDWDRRGDIQDRTVEAAERLLRPGMDVVGHSFGATVALRLAVTHPQLIRSVTLFEPVFEALERGDDAQAARVFNRMWGTEDSPRWPELPESTRAAMTRSIHVIPAADEMLYRDRAGLLRPGVLDRATMPVLLVRGSLTHPVIGAINDGLARRLPEARNVVIPGAGHMVPITHPAQSAVHLRALFAETA